MDLDPDTRWFFLGPTHLYSLVQTCNRGLLIFDTFPNALHAIEDIESLNDLINH